MEAAIKQAIQLGKATVLGFINQQMSHMYPDYQDVSSIQPVGGKKFKKFSDFINAAIQDGIIKRDGDYLQLVD